MRRTHGGDWWAKYLLLFLVPICPRNLCKVYVLALIEEILSLNFLIIVIYYLHLCLLNV
jgi:hypothetical protein